MSNITVNVITPGSRVVIGDTMVATVIAVSIGGPNLNIQYQCVWWDGRDRVTQWLEAFEVKREDDTDQIAIGFLSTGND